MGGGDDMDEGGVPAFVGLYETFVKTQVAAAVKATNDLGIKKLGDYMQTAYNTTLELIKRVPNSKKPNNAAFGEFLKPMFDSIGAIDNLRYRAKDFKTVCVHVCVLLMLCQR